MFEVGSKIVYGETGVCTVESISPLAISGAAKEKLYYHLRPFVGSGDYFAPVDTPVFMRPVMSSDEVLAFIDRIPDIEPAICYDSRFNHVDAFYKELFKLHTSDALVSVIKGLRIRTQEKKNKSSRAEATMRRAMDILYGEFAVVLGIELKEVENFITQRLGSALL